MATFREVSGTFKRLDGTIPYGSAVEFYLDASSYAADATLFPKEKRIVGYVGPDGTLRRTSKDGPVNVPLWCNSDEAEEACVIKMRWPGSQRVDQFSVPEGVGAINLAALIALNGDPATPQGETVLALVQPYIDAADAAADAATAAAAAANAAAAAYAEQVLYSHLDPSGVRPDGTIWLQY